MAASAETKPGYTLEITRLLNAPRALVWDAWTKHEHALKWAGPKDYPAVDADHDVRPGGKWRTCLKGADGEELWQGGEYREVVPQERLVFTSRWDGDDFDTLITITFADKGGKTEMHFRQDGLSSAESRDGHRGGWNSSFDRLDEFLAAAR